VAAQWKRAAADGELIGCPVVTLELLYDASGREQVERVADALAGLRQAPLDRTVTAAAIGAVRELAAAGSPGSHRVRVPDALVAAAAAQRGFGVLHYDHHFDRLATVLEFRSQWVAAAGSID
jgi:predicted nucleic acid-binding protein